MARFIGGLNIEISRPLNLCRYTHLTDLVEYACNVEKDLRTHATNSYRPPPAKNVNWQKNPREYNGTNNKGTHPVARTPPPPQTQNRYTPPAPQKRPPPVCFKCQGRGHIKANCPNNKIYILTAEGNYESDEDDGIEEPRTLALNVPTEGINPNPNSDPESEEDWCHQNFAILQSLSTQVPPDPTIGQRTNIFHSKCIVKEKVCLLIIDGGSCTNVCSTELVEELQLPTLHHPNPYNLQWLNDSNGLKVKKQVLLPIRIAKYEDEILCDVIPMTACHILLGRPWAYDREILHDGKTNKYTVNKDGKKIRLHPLPQAEVVAAQLLFKKRREEKLREKKFREVNRVGQSELDSESGSERKKSEETSEEKDLVLTTQRKVDRNLIKKLPLLLTLLQERSLTIRLPNFLPTEIKKYLQGNGACFPIESQQQPMEELSKEKYALPLYHFFSADRENKAKNIHDLHKKEGWSIKSKGATYVRQSRERGSPVVFQPGDWDGLHATNLAPCEFEDSDSRTNPFEGEGNDANPQTPMGLIPNFDNHYIEGLNNGPKYSKRVLNYFYTRRLKGRQWASPQNNRVINYEAHILFKDDGRLRPKLTNGPKCNLSWKEVLGLIPINARLKGQNAIKHF